MDLARWGVIEARNTDNLPVRVWPCRVDQAPAPRPGETLRWIIGDSIAVNVTVAHRITRERLKQIAAWAGTPTPPWLATIAPREPRGYGGWKSRPLLRRCPDGREERFASVSAAARAMGKSRMALHKRLLDGRADGDGCVWTSCN